MRKHGCFAIDNRVTGRVSAAIYRCIQRPINPEFSVPPGMEGKAYDTASDEKGSAPFWVLQKTRYARASGAHKSPRFCVPMRSVRLTAP